MAGARSRASFCVARGSHNAEGHHRLSQDRTTRRTMQDTSRCIEMKISERVSRALLQEACCPD